jgi:fibronectin type 3 domain-containing protein
MRHGWRGAVALAVVFFGCTLLLLSCAAGPKPEGADFMSDESVYEDGDESRSQADVFVSPRARDKVYRKVAVMPFRAPVELVGASVADMVATEILKTYKYELIERSQMEQVLNEQSLGMKGVTDSTIAMQVGRILGVSGVIIGTVPEYGMRAVGSLELPAVGINIRMIDAETGSVIWTVTDSAISQKVVSLSAFARRLIKSMVHRLRIEWVRTGDTYAANLMPAQVTLSRGNIRSAVIKVFSGSQKRVRAYTLYRSRTKRGPYRKVSCRKNTGEKTVVFEDKNLLDAETYYYKVDAVSVTGLHSPMEGPFEITTAGAPDPVMDLAATGGQIRKVTLGWTPSRSNVVVGYALYRATSKKGPYKQIKVFKDRKVHQYVDAGGGRSHRDAGNLADKQAYYYKIRAINTVGVHSPDSPVASAVTCGPPPPVVEFMAQSGLARKVALNWVPVQAREVKGYVIYRGEKENGPFTKVVYLKGREKTKYLDRGKSSGWDDRGKLKDNAEYFYKIQSLNIVDVHSPDSVVASAITKPVPQPIAGLSCSQKMVKQAELQWQAAPESDIKWYEIYRGNTDQKVEKRIAKVKAGQRHFTDKRLKDGNTYCYKIRAVDRDELSGDFSEVVCSQTKPIPKTPHGLIAEFKAGRVVLNWQENAENDIIEYKIYRHGFLTWAHLGKTEQTVFQYSQKIKPGSKETFRVVAVDKDQLESRPSEAVTVVIPK